MKFTQISVLASLLATAISFSAFAADKALIVGVGKYADARNNLPGIDLDVANFKRAIKRLGVKGSNIKVLSDDQATLKNLKYQMKNWLGNVSKNDKVFFYFSGHGSQLEDTNGDEPDGLDEFLVMHEFKPSGGGALTDDMLGQLLKAIPSQNVYAFVDACHSGTATKGLKLTNRSLGEAKGVAKFLKYQGMPQAKSSASRGVGIRAKSSDNYVALTATQDDELAIATAQGSIFTLGIDRAIQKAMAKGSSLTPRNLINDATVYVHANTGSRDRFTPSLTGNSKLFDKQIQLRTTSSDGEYWQRLDQAASNNQSLKAWSDKKSYKFDDQIKYYVDIPRNGYLNVVTVDNQDNAVVVFPNQFKPSNKVKKGKLSLDSRDSVGFEFYASDPLGKSLTLFIVTEEPLDLYKKTAEGRDKNGNITAQIATLSASALKALDKGVAVRASRKGVWTTKVITNVVR